MIGEDLNARTLGMLIRQIGNMGLHLTKDFHFAVPDRLPVYILSPPLWPFFHRFYP
jgi:hypothetical protein